MKAFVRSITRFDIVACTLILCVGGFQLAFVERGAAFYSGDTTYLELARSLLRHHLYGFDFRAETTLPPGFPAMLAGVMTIAGDAHDVLVRTVVVSATLGTLLTYFLIRSAQGRMAAAIICLLIATSPPWFSFVS